MAGSQKVERIVLDPETQRGCLGFESEMAGPCPALAARGAELIDGDAHRHAGAAVVAIGTVGENAAAPEAHAHQVAIELVADQVAGRGDLRACHSAWKVAARIGGSDVELQYRVGKVVQQ